jgi:hypothetical protein
MRLQYLAVACTKAASYGPWNAIAVIVHEMCARALDLAHFP